jgi:hypothetical protein
LGHGKSRSNDNSRKRRRETTAAQDYAETISKQLTGTTRSVSHKGQSGNGLAFFSSREMEAERAPGPACEI